MTESLEQKLFKAIESDDLNAFDALTAKTPCGKYRLGRFPVLSLLYLFNSRAIIKAYEKELIKISAWEKLGEPVGIVERFVRKAGKCLRLYFDTVVSPLEMLLILDKTAKVKELYPSARPSEAVKARLKTIYYVKYALSVRFEGDGIILDRRPLRRREKKRIAAVAVGGVLAAAIVVGTPVSIVAYVKAHAGDVSSLAQIDFAEKTTYTLTRDITIPEDFSVEEVNCTIIGDGYKLVLGKNASLGELSGTMRDVKFQTSGSPIFKACTESATLTDVTVNVKADVETNESSAFVALVNYGTFNRVKVNVSGKVSAVVGEGNDDELVFGGMVGANSYAYDDSSRIVYGRIKNSSVNFKGFSLSGETAANATFGGIVGVNSGIVEKCKISGDIVADTFDLAGACYINNYTLTGIASSASLSQTSDDEDWSPIVGGIVVENWATVERCKNSGDISLVGQGLAICGGIAARTYGQSYYCVASGNIEVKAKNAYVGGIYGISQVATDGFYVYFGAADYCISTVKISATLGEEASCVGGVAGLVQEATIGVSYYGGGVTSCIFMGEIGGNFDYAGNIVGVCGAVVYNRNSYLSGGVLYPNFAGNYYLDNGLSSFGAVAESEDKFTRVEGKGATALKESEIKGSSLYKDIIKNA
ncbi:MAG: hypothetical protein J1G38_02010 [Clostridiales bacterium]|nr:hypothetical protein [Clostridiales bacterium]